MELAKFRGASDGKVTKSGSHRAVRFSSERRHLLSELAGGVGPGGRISLALLSPGGWKQSRPTGTSAIWFPARRCLGPMVPTPARGPRRPNQLHFSVAYRNNVCVHTDKGSWFKKLSPWDNRLLFLWGRYFIKMTFLMTWYDNRWNNRWLFQLFMSVFIGQNTELATLHQFPHFFVLFCSVC